MRIEGLSLIGHLQSINSQDFNKFAFMSATAFSRAQSLGEDKTVEIDVLGLTGLAKTLLREEICMLFDPIGPTYTHDYEISIALATLQGKIKNPSGKRTDEEFLEANEEDNRLMQLFIQLPGRRFLVREKPGTTQDPFTKVGSSRGDWGFDKRFRNRRSMFHIILGGEEEFRRGNVYRRLILARESKDANWASGNKAYVQHHLAIAEQIHFLGGEEGVIGSKELEVYKGMSLQDIGSYLYREKGAMVDFTKNVIRPRISYFLYSSLSSERVIFFCNEWIKDWRQVFSGYSKVELNSQRGIHRVLWEYAQEKGDKKLEEELRRMMVPELIDLELR